VLGSTWPDIGRSAIIAVIVGGAVTLFGRDLMAHAFDPQHAAAIGLPVRLLHYGLLAMVSLAVVGALQATGLVLAIALLIAPGAISFLLTRRFGTMLVMSACIAVVSALAGVYASFFIDSAPAPTIVLAMTIQFVAAFAWSQVRDRRAAMRT
jgi:manganese/iron transport system permease protein